MGSPYLTNPAKLDRLVESATAAVGEAVAAAYGDPEPVPAERCEAVAGGDEIDLGVHTLSVIDAPGHAPHHACLHEDESGALVAGDAAGMARPGTELRPTSPPPDFDLDAWLDTLDGLIETDPAVLCYAHFGPEQDAVGALEAYRELLPRFVDAVAEASESLGESVDAVADGESVDAVADGESVDAGADGSIDAIADVLREQWGGPTLEADVSGVLRYLSD